MRKVLFSLIALAAATAAAQTRPEAGVDVCKLMSREEMQACQSTKQGDVSGARSAYCDQVSQERVAKCLEQPAAAEDGSASSGATAPRPDEKPKAPEPA